MTDRELEERIRTAAEHAAPDRLEDILSLCTEQNRGSMVSRSRDADIGPAVSFRLILDVNPSVYLEVDSEERVVRAEALNEDAGEMLRETVLEDLLLDEAVDAIVEYMLQAGYLSEIQNSILVSLDCDDGGDADMQRKLQQKVSGIIEEAMEDGLGETEDGVSVLSQTVDEEDDDLARLAAEYGISVGKAALIRKVAASDAAAGPEDDGDEADRLTFEDLAPLTVSEIALLAQERDLPDDEVTRIGHASDKGYIGHDGALRAAYDYAGVDAAQVGKQKVKLDAKKGLMIYKVKLKTKKGTCKYYLDARTGEMVRRKKDVKKGTDEKRSKDMSKKKKKYYNYYYGTNSTAVTVPAGAIGEQAAKAAALNHAGVPENQALYVYANPQIGHGPDHYDVKFVANGMKYKYAIGLYDGEVYGRAVKNKAAKGKYVYEGNYHEHYAPMGPGMAQPAAPAQAAAPDAPAAAPAQDPAEDTAPGPAQAPDCAAPGPAPVPPAARVTPGNMISEQQALDIALRQAALAPTDLIRWKVKLKNKHGMLLYRFKLKIPGFEHEIDVDAYTGNVTKHHKEFDH